MMIPFIEPLYTNGITFCLSFLTWYLLLFSDLFLDYCTGGRHTTFNRFIIVIYFILSFLLLALQSFAEYTLCTGYIFTKVLESGNTCMHNIKGVKFYVVFPL